MKIFWYTILGLIGLWILWFVGNYYGLVSLQFFGVRYANVHRQIFEQSQSYVEWLRQELGKYRLEYQRSENTGDKEAIATMLLNDFANVDRTTMNPLDRNFLESLEK